MSDCDASGVGKREAHSENEMEIAEHLIEAKASESEIAKVNKGELYLRKIIRVIVYCCDSLLVKCVRSGFYCIFLIKSFRRSRLLFWGVTVIFTKLIN